MSENKQVREPASTDRPAGSAQFREKGMDVVNMTTSASSGHVQAQNTGTDDPDVD